MTRLLLPLTLLLIGLSFTDDAEAMPVHDPNKTEVCR